MLGVGAGPCLAPVPAAWCQSCATVSCVALPPPCCPQTLLGRRGVQGEELLAPFRVPSVRSPSSCCCGVFGVPPPAQPPLSTQRGDAAGLGDPLGSAQDPALRRLRPGGVRRPHRLPRGLLRPVRPRAAAAHPLPGTAPALSPPLSPQTPPGTCAVWRRCASRCASSCSASTRCPRGRSRWTMPKSPLPSGPR